MLTFSSHRVSLNVFLQARRPGGQKPVCELHLLEMQKEGRGRAQRTALISQPLRSPPWRYTERPTAPTPRGHLLLASSHPAAGPREGRVGSGRGVEQSAKLPLPTAAKIPGCSPTLRSCSLYVLSGGNRCPLITSLLLDLADKKGHVHRVRSLVVSLLPQPTLKYLSPYLSYGPVSLHTEDEI